MSDDSVRLFSRFEFFLLLEQRFELRLFFGCGVGRERVVLSDVDVRVDFDEVDFGSVADGVKGFRGEEEVAEIR